MTGSRDNSEIPRPEPNFVVEEGISSNSSSNMSSRIGKNISNSIVRGGRGSDSDSGINTAIGNDEDDDNEDIDHEAPGGSTMASTPSMEEEKTTTTTTTTMALTKKKEKLEEQGRRRKEDSHLSRLERGRDDTKEQEGKLPPPPASKIAAAAAAAIASSSVAGESDSASASASASASDEVESQQYWTWGVVFYFPWITTSRSYHCVLTKRWTEFIGLVLIVASVCAMAIGIFWLVTAMRNRNPARGTTPIQEPHSPFPPSASPSIAFTPKPAPIQTKDNIVLTRSRWILQGSLTAASASASSMSTSTSTRAQWGTIMALSKDGLTMAVGTAMKTTDPRNNDHDDDRPGVWVFHRRPMNISTTVAGVEYHDHHELNSFVVTSDNLAAVAAEASGEGYQAFGGGRGALALSRSGRILAMAVGGGSIAVLERRSGDDNDHDNDRVESDNHGQGTDSSSWHFLGSSPPIEDVAGMPSSKVGSSVVAVSSDGSVLAVSSPRNDINGTDAGAVRVFHLVVVGERTEWNQMGDDLLGEMEGEFFGSDVALASDDDRGLITLAVGATQAGRMSNVTNKTEAGYVRLFAWDNTTARWDQIGKVLSGNKWRDGLFGSSISLSADGGFLAVGSPLYDDGRGRVVFFRRYWMRTATTSGSGSGSGVWADYRKSDAGEEGLMEGDESGDLFGYSVDLSDDGMTTAIGIPMPPDHEAEGEVGEATAEADTSRFGSAGRVLVFQYLDDCRSWVLKGQKTEGRGRHDQWGWNVALAGDGKSFAASAPFHDSNDIGEDSGEVRYYYDEDRDGVSWQQVGQTLTGSFNLDVFGVSMALSDDGTLLVAGTGFADTINGDNSGYVEVRRFEADENANGESGRWVLEGERFEGRVRRSVLGIDVDISGDGSILALGHRFGEVHILSPHEGPNGTNLWNKTTELSVSVNEYTNSRVGTSVAMSNDGLILAVGSWSDSNSSHRAGSVTVFSRESTNSTSWSFMGSPIYGRNSSDGLGSSVAISGDGRTVAAAYGVSEEDYTKPGFVRVFRYDGEEDGSVQWVQIGRDLSGFLVEVPFSFLRLCLNSDGTVLATGSYILDPGDFHNLGDVYVYRFAGGDWNMLGDRISGLGVSLRDTPDGLVLGLGIPFADFGSFSCENRGMVRVLLWEDSHQHWRQIGDDIVGLEGRDGLGCSVALSADASILATSGPLSSEAGWMYSGIVRVFRRVSPKHEMGGEG